MGAMRVGCSSRDEGSRGITGVPGQGPCQGGKRCPGHQMSLYTMQVPNSIFRGKVAEAAAPKGEVKWQGTCSSIHL